MKEIMEEYSTTFFECMSAWPDDIFDIIIPTDSAEPLQYSNIDTIVCSFFTMS